MHSNLISNAIISIFIVTISCVLVTCVSLEEDLTLTRSQKEILDTFRAEMTPSLPEEYMKEDIYLIRFLRSKNFNLGQAKTFLLENLQWRKQNNMSTIQDEYWGDMQQDYPYYVDTVDKAGRPIVSLRFGEWDVRRAVLTNRGQRLIRYLYKGLDEATTKVRTLQGEGKAVTQWISLLDMDGYSFITHNCIQCLSIYISYVTAYESYFPGSVHDIILINVPPIFETVLRVTKPLLRSATVDVLHVFGMNKQQWSKYLLQNISPDQLEPNFGGTKIRSRS